MMTINNILFLTAIESSRDQVMLRIGITPSRYRTCRPLHTVTISVSNDFPRTSLVSQRCLWITSIRLILTGGLRVIGNGGQDVDFASSGGTECVDFASSTRAFSRA
jgi:hypothetical protein